MNDTEEIQRSSFELAGYWACQQACRLAMALGWGLRAYGIENFPRQGGGIVCSNHQSHFDPVLVGISCRRRMNFLARKSLFHFGPFGRLIAFLDAIPLDREGIGIAGIRETIRRSRRSELVVLFPEGGRSSDGKMAPLMPGVCAVAQRSKVPIIPVGIAGAFQAWPRTRNFPTLGTIVVQVGTPIPVEGYLNLDDQQLVDLLSHRIGQCVNEAERRRSLLIR